MYKLLMTSRKQIKFARNFLCLFLACLVWLFSSARPFFDVQKNITLDFNNLTVKQVFKELNSKTGLKFIYSPNDIDDSKRISMTFKDQPVKVVLDRIFSTLTIILLDNWRVSLRYSAPENPVTTIRISGYVVSALLEEAADH